MRVTIQFESHRNELVRIYELEHDEVLEYYDQPPPIELVYWLPGSRVIFGVAEEICPSVKLRNIKQESLDESGKVIANRF